MKKKKLPSIRTKINARVRDRIKKQREWYNLRPVLGYSNFAIFHILLGGREIGKSYSITQFFVDQFIKKGRPFYWMRLTDSSAKKLLRNKAQKLVDPAIRRKYNLDLTTIDNSVYQVLKRSKEGKILEKKLMCYVLDLSTFYADKGSGYYDQDFLKDPNMYYNICLDEMNREKNERKTFDILYAFVNQLENIVRSTKQRIRVFMVGNTLEEASDLLCAFNFIPVEFGVYKLKKKRAVIEYIEPSEAYLKRRKGTIADILLPNASTFTNKVECDNTLIVNKRLTRALYGIKFSKDKKDWFTVWDDNIVTRYTGQTAISFKAMRPYIDELFRVDIQKSVIDVFDARGYKFKDLITFKLFQKNLELLKPRKN